MKKDSQGYILCFKEGIDTTKPDHLQRVVRKERFLSPSFVANKSMFNEQGWKIVEDMEAPALPPSMANIEPVTFNDTFKHIETAIEQQEIIQPLEEEEINLPVNETKPKRPRIKKPKKRAYNRKPKTEIAHAD